MISDFSNFVSVFSNLKDLRELTVKGNNFLKNSFTKSSAATISSKKDGNDRIDDVECKIMSENSVRKNIVMTLLPSCTMLQEVDGYTTTQIIDKFNDAALKKELKQSMFKTWGNGDEKDADKDYMEAGIYVDVSDSDSDDENMKNDEDDLDQLESRRVLSKEDIEKIESVFTNLVATTRDVLNTITSNFDMDILTAKKMVSNMKRSHKVKSKPTIVTNSEQELNTDVTAKEIEEWISVHGGSLSVDKEEAEKKQLDASASMSERNEEHQPMMKIKEPASSPSSFIPSPSKQRIVVPTRPHSANETLKSPSGQEQMSPSAASISALDMTSLSGKLKSFSILDTRGHSKKSPHDYGMPLSARDVSTRREGLLEASTTIRTSSGSGSDIDNGPVHANTKQGPRKSKFESEMTISPAKTVGRTSLADVYGKPSSATNMASSIRGFRIPPSAKDKLAKLAF